MPSRAYEKIIDGLKKEVERGEFKDKIDFKILDFPKDSEEYDSACNILSGMNVDIIYAVTTPVALSAKKCVKDKPIIFNAVGDPLGAGILKNLREPGENITGVSNFSRELTAKRLEVFKAAFQDLKTVLTFYNPDNAFSALAIKDLKKAAMVLEIDLILVMGKTGDELWRKISGIDLKKVDGIYLLPDAAAFSIFNEVVELSKQFKIPIMAHESGLVERGATISYGADFYELGRLSYVYISAILKGDRAGKLPVFFPDRFLLVVNQKSVEQLGLQLSPETLFFADRII